MDRRHLLIAAALGYARLARGDAIPPELAPLVPRAATLRSVQDPGHAHDKPYHVAGALESGGEVVYALRGTRMFEFAMSESADPKAAVVALLRHYDGKVAELGGKRLNRGFDASKWFEVNAKLHLFTRPTPTGPQQFGLWIQNGGELHYLMLFPAPDARPASAQDLSARLANFGSAPLYIHFDTNESELKSDGRAAVEEIARVMKTEPTLQLSIDGHTDNVGSAQANRKLAHARAHSVLAAVVAQGVDAKRLSARGLGADAPIADNRTEEGRAKNRRVELVKVNR
jgi:OOP family OmpA-OmpF porin